MKLKNGWHKYRALDHACPFVQPCRPTTAAATRTLVGNIDRAMVLDKITKHNQYTGASGYHIHDFNIYHPCIVCSYLIYKLWPVWNWASIKRLRFGNNRHLPLLAGGRGISSIILFSLPPHLPWPRHAPQLAYRGMLRCQHIGVRREKQSWRYYSCQAYKARQKYPVNVDVLY